MREWIAIKLLTKFEIHGWILDWAWEHAVSRPYRARHN